MSESLNSASFQLDLDEKAGVWSLETKHVAAPILENISPFALVRRKGRRFAVPSTEWQLAENPVERQSLQGRGLELRLRSIEEQGVRCTLTLALPLEHPLFLWKLSLHNHGSEPLQVDRLEMLCRREGAAGAALPLHFPQANPELAFFSNGWQSWNYTGVYSTGDRMRRTRLGPLTSPMRVNPGSPHPRAEGFFASEMFGVIGDRSSRTGLLAGFLSQRQQFGSLTASLQRTPSLRIWATGDGVRLDPGATLHSDWACIQVVKIDQPHPLDPYLNAVAREHDLPPITEPSPVGWCSWYHYFQDISAEEVRRNLKSAKELRAELPLDIIQIDDGFQTRVGDWFSFVDEFPQGVAPLAEEIHREGFTPGLWLAPYIVDPRSKLAQEHPDWLLRGSFNRPVNAGFTGWGVFATALDLTNPHALEHTRQVVHTAAHDWGYPYLKLDFLYAAALRGRRYDPTHTRAQTLRMGLEALREAAGPETTLLGCGCPLGPAIGIFEAMRIGADVAPHWTPVYKGIELPVREEPDLPAARNAIQNSLTRASLHRLWWINDPDALLLRPETELSLPEVRSLATVIALTGGAVIISDDLSKLPSDRLAIAQAMLPPVGKRPSVPDWFNRPMPERLRVDLENDTGCWHMLGLFNWSEESRELTWRPEGFGLPGNGDYHLHEFWSGRPYLDAEPGLSFGTIPPHGCLLLAAREPGDGAQYLGSDLHISQGLEIASWQAEESGLRFRLVRPGKVTGSITLRLPAQPDEAVLEGEPVAWHHVRGAYRFAVCFESEANAFLRW